MKMCHWNFKWIVVSLILFGLIFSLTGCQSGAETTSEPVNQALSIGYCPSMENFLGGLPAPQFDVQFIPYDNSSAALAALNAGQVQAVVIGRKAWEGEIAADVRLVLLEDGLTLTAARQSAIYYDDLKQVPIYTVEKQGDVQKLFPDGTTVLYFDDLQALSQSLDDSVAVLLRWSQVSPGQQLLIPVNEAGNKIPAFRSPHFYYHKDFEETLYFIIDAF